MSSGRIADHDGLAASFGVISRILYRGLDQDASRALAQRSPREVGRQLQIEMKSSITIVLPCVELTTTTDTSIVEALTVISPSSTGLPKK